MSPVVLLIAILVTVGGTALLIGVLSRINTPPQARRRTGEGETAVGVHVGGEGRGARQEADGSNTSPDGGDGGGGGD